jgi:hypothetical protein
VGFAGGGVGGHYYCWLRGVGGCGEVGVVHEGDVGLEVGAGCEMELVWGVSLSEGLDGKETYESGIL